MCTHQCCFKVATTHTRNVLTKRVMYKYMYVHVCTLYHTLVHRCMYYIIDHYIMDRASKLTMDQVSHYGASQHRPCVTLKRVYIHVHVHVVVYHTS